MGLVAITPGAGFVSLWSSFVIGALVSPFCYYFISVIKHRLGLDDALDAFGCHGIGGIFGGIMTGIFADPAVNHQTGLLYGGTELFIAQIISIVFTILLRGHILSIDPCDQTRATDPGHRTRRSYWNGSQ